VEAAEAASEASEGAGDEHRIEALLCQRSFSDRASRGKFVLVKWQRSGFDDCTWEERKHMHREALDDFERQAALPFCLSELLSLPPHANEVLLEREKLLPMPRSHGGGSDESDESDDDEDDDDDEDASAVHSSVCAVMSPSTKKLRNDLAVHDISYSMPLLPGGVMSEQEMFDRDENVRGNALLWCVLANACSAVLTLLLIGVHCCCCCCCARFVN
jgi:hypothetical protein